MRKHTHFIVIHCSATPPDMDIGVDEIRKWHTDPVPKGRGWKDIGYARVIKRDGTVQPGRNVQGDVPDVNEVGAHVAGYNHCSVGICLVGGVDKMMNPDDNFTPEQMLSLRRELEFLKILFPNAKIVGHNDLDPNKACPAFDLHSWLANENLI